MAKSGKRKIRRHVVKAIVFIKATFNNTLITITDPNGDTICRDSGGTVGFKGSRKSTPFAAQRAAENCAKTAMRYGVREVEIKVKGRTATYVKQRLMEIIDSRGLGCDIGVSRIDNWLYLEKLI